MQQTDRAWAAGFMDGGGYLGAGAWTHKGVSRVQSQAKIEVAQTRSTPLLQLERLFGGHVRVYQNTHGAVFTWYLYGAKAMAALEQMRPYLVLKREQADLVIEFQTTKFSNRRGNPNGQVSDGGFAHRTELHDRLKQLNA